MLLLAKDAAAQRVEEAWGSLTWLAGESLTGSDVTLGRVVITQGMHNPRHSHPNSGEVLYLLRGRLRHLIGSEEFLMEPGDTSFVPAGVPHLAYSVGDVDAEMMVTYPTGRRQYLPEE
jgi:quercetin dioxygenase-like cupin family protein